MKQPAKIIAILSVLIIGASVVWAEQSNQDADLSGYYGEKDGEWIGVAMREGDNLAVGWHRTDGANLGVALYKIGKSAKSPTLTGGWAAYPGGGIVKDSPTWSRSLK